MRLHATLFLLLAFFPSPSRPCSIVGAPAAPESLVDKAPIIVRATAVDYETPPADPDTWTTGMPDSRVRFRVEEVVKGQGVPTTFVLHGYLGQEDDWNDRELPYDFVRPGGRAGSCWANRYREGGQFLLFLTWIDGSMDLFRRPLAAINEQLRGPRDPWLFWVKGFLAARGLREEASREGGDG